MDAKVFGQGLADQLKQSVDCWHTQGFAPIRQAWLALAMGVGKAIAVRLSDAKVLHGHFEGLDFDGGLYFAHRAA